MSRDIRHWMPLYIADYLADTGHLTTAEHGAYLLLIMHYWSNGSLPEDERKIARIARMTAGEWEEARVAISDFFTDGWRHARIEKELSEAQAAYERRANAGRKGGMASRRKEQCESNASSNAEAQLKQPQPQPSLEPTDSGSSRSLLVASPTAPRKASRAKPRSQISESAMPSPTDVEAAKKAGLTRETMIQQWTKFRDYHRAKGSLMADWSAAWRTWLGNMAQFQPARAGPRQQPDETDPILAAARRRLAQSSDYATPDAAEYPELFHENAYDPADYDGPCTIDAQATG